MGPVQTVTWIRFGLTLPATLGAAANLALALVRLGELESARTLSQHTLDRCRQVLGDDQPTTLLSAATLALALAYLADYESARTLSHDTVERCQRVFGPDHPTTLYAAAALIELDKLEPACTPHPCQDTVSAVGGCPAPTTPSP